MSSTSIQTQPYHTTIASDNKWMTAETLARSLDNHPTSQLSTVIVG